MKELIFATNNTHKAEEVKLIFGNLVKVITLKEAGIDIDIPEPYDTLEKNASAKSRTIYEMTGRDCFSEDTGLEVESLEGAPGVMSARYAGDEKSFDKNIVKLLDELSSHLDRKARFRAILSLIVDGKETLFEGICNGKIIHEPRGSAGFGYDPVFVPEGENRTFAEMSIQEKTRYSHRRKAMDKLVAFLQNLNTKPQN